jgi:hypothetical protein
MASDSAPRYCQTAFPSYSFVPGANPHPRWDPDGHSYSPPGTPEATITYCAPADWRSSEDYLFGCDLYNHRYWWEAHEAWEGLWQLTDRRSAQGRFLKSLIQVAACHLILHMGKPQAVETMLPRIDANLNVVLDTHPEATFMGLDVRQWRSHVNAYFSDLLREGAPCPEHAGYPYPLIHLEGF